MITAQRLRDLLAYDPETGIMKWRIASGRVKPGTPITCTDSRGYVVVRVDGALQRVHRLAWLYVHGIAPSVIDHVNGNPGDNRIANLRECSIRQNTMNRSMQSNNTSGHVGVCFCKRRQKFRATITEGGKQISLGYFDSAVEASSAYKSRAQKAFGEFYKELQP